ncbi:MAG: four helix bundle protein [Bacteroidales bacterium]|nr:four helix bundle protein [Bacteroidales bacterium]
MDQEELKRRTKNFALNAIKLFNLLPKTEVAKLIGRQFVKSATSVGANYRAAILARSKKEFYAKICIVVEETDETIYWLEILEESGIFSDPLILELKKEGGELLLIFSKTRKTTKDSL